MSEEILKKYQIESPQGCRRFVSGFENGMPCAYILGGTGLFFLISLLKNLIRNDEKIIK